MSQNDSQKSAKIIQSAARSNKVLHSTIGLLQKANTLGGTPRSKEVCRVIAAKFESITKNVDQMEAASLQQLLALINELSELQTSFIISEKLYIGLLTKSCGVLRTSLVQIQKNGEAKHFDEVDALIPELRKHLPKTQKTKESPDNKSENEVESSTEETIVLTSDEEKDVEIMLSPDEEEDEVDDGVFGEQHIQSFFEDPDIDSFAAEEGEVDLVVPESKVAKDTVHSAVTYFETLQQQTSGSIVNDEDGLVFDESSIQEALTLCSQLQWFLSEDLSSGQYQQLKSIFPFYRSPQELLDYVKILFAGGNTAKEKTIRIYAAKIIGTYNVVSLIRKNKQIFEGMAISEIQEIHAALLEYAEAPLINIKNLLPRNIQSQYEWTRRNLQKNISHILYGSEDIFMDVHNQELIVERFREFSHALLCDSRILQYVTWKHEYFKYWIHTELYEIDKRNLESKAAKKPQYALAKVVAYQNLEHLFASLDEEDRALDRKKELGEKVCEDLKNPHNYFSSTNPLDPEDLLEDSRKQEKEFLDSLSIVQLATLAESIHHSIAALQSADQLKGEVPDAMNVRSIQIASPAKVESVCQTSMLKMQWQQTKKLSNLFSKKALATLKRITGKLNTASKDQSKHKIAMMVEQLASGNPLPKAEVEWAGFGKEVNGEIYAARIPDMLRPFFEHNRYELNLYAEFQTLVHHTLEYYKGVGYLQRMKREYIDRKLQGSHLDESVYLKVAEGVVL
ncbi:MAG: hypothetical protein HQM14_21955, partial [SAR324 cluster bacterium]|nr:hypothetical protein [SAR324 cluster bacterium]